MNSDRIELYDDGIGFVECVDYMGSDLTIVNSARVSFGKHKEELDDKDIKLINYLVKNKHTSTFEHNVITFRIKVPLFIRSQHMRHRTWSYNEISRRYTEENIQFYAPSMFRSQSRSNRQASTEDLINPVLNTNTVHGGKSVSYMVKAHNKSCMQLYDALLEGGICREQARGVLPQSIYTEYYGTVNLNNLLKFIDLRTHAGAQWEIQRLASAMLEIANKKWPIAIKSYQECRR
tara:strand:+ start:346 stop:1047 length:702 start_codon:yes stop_codon:yes gene_type:complete